LPQWFVEQQDALEAEGYPRLENVPDRVDATVDQGHWDEVTRELDEAGRQMQADRRSTPVNRTPAAQDVRAQRFDERAREEIAATRRQLGLPPREEDATTEDPAEAPADPAAAPAAQDPSTTPDE